MTTSWQLLGGVHRWNRRQSLACAIGPAGRSNDILKLRMPFQDPPDILSMQDEKVTEAEGYDLASATPGRPKDSQLAEKFAGAQKRSSITVTHLEGAGCDEVHGMAAITTIGDDFTWCYQMSSHLPGDSLALGFGQILKDRDLVDQRIAIEARIQCRWFVGAGDPSLHVFQKGPVELSADDGFTQETVIAPYFPTQRCPFDEGLTKLKCIGWILQLHCPMRVVCAAQTFVDQFRQILRSIDADQTFEPGADEGLKITENDLPLEQQVKAPRQHSREKSINAEIALQDDGRAERFGKVEAFRSCSLIARSAADDHRLRRRLRDRDQGADPLYQRRAVAHRHPGLLGRRLDRRQWHSGEVVDHSLLSTSVAEIDAKHNRYDFTGKTVVLPNSMLLTHHVKNQNFLKTYVFHEFSIYTEPEINVVDARDFILERIETYSADFSDVARRYNALIEKRSGVDVPNPEPRVYVTTNELAKSVFTVIIFCPVKEAVELEQKITRDFLTFFYERRKAPDVKRLVGP